MSGLGSSPPSTRRTPHERIEVSLGLDDLAGLSISNEAATGYEVSLNTNNTSLYLVNIFRI